GATQGAALRLDDSSSIVLSIAAHDAPVCLKVLIHPKASQETFVRAIQNITAPQDLTQLTQPGPPQWTPPLVTKGDIGPPFGPFAIDTLTLPYENPWKSLMFVSG